MFNLYLLYMLIRLLLSSKLTIKSEQYLSFLIPLWIIDVYCLCRSKHELFLNVLISDDLCKITFFNLNKLYYFLIKIGIYVEECNRKETTPRVY